MAAGRRRLRPALGLPVVLVAAGFGLSACSQQNGVTLARQACVHVHKSVVEYRHSLEPGVTSADQTHLQTEAYTQLRDALPLAAAATSDDGSWNALMTALDESNTVDEAHLVPSLLGQCAVADANVNVNPDNPQSPSGSGSVPGLDSNSNPDSPGS